MDLGGSASHYNHRRVQSVDDPHRAPAIVGAIGLGAGGAVKKIGETGQEIARLRLIVALAEGLSGDRVTLVIQALLARAAK